MEAPLIAAKSELEEKKKVLSEYKALEKLADDLLDVVMEAGGDNLHENNGQNLDEEIMKGFIDNAMEDFTEVWKVAQTRGSRRADGGNIGGGHEDSFGDHNLDIVEKALGSNGGKKGDANGGGDPE